jgi:hypothetical protein
MANAELLLAGLTAFWLLNPGSVAQSQNGKTLLEKSGKSVPFPCNSVVVSNSHWSYTSNI